MEITPGRDVAEARIVVLRNLQPFGPGFHRQIAKGQARGQVLKKGERVLTYEVAQTFPDEAVLVTERTSIEFC